jgi:hypothetical protein
MMKTPMLIALLSFFAAGVSAQPADTTAVAAPVVAAAQTTPAPATTPPAAAPSDPSSGRKLKLGAGVHYMKTVGSISDTPEFNSDALNLLVAGKLGLGLIAIEGDSEWALDYGGSDKTLWIPQVFGLVDLRRIYGGVGIGSGYFDGEWFNNPVYTLRAGINLPLGRLSLDINANYQFISSSALEGLGSEDLDTVTLGATAWF